MHICPSCLSSKAIKLKKTTNSISRFSHLFKPSIVVAVRLFDFIVISKVENASSTTNHVLLISWGRLVVKSTTKSFVVLY
jgi:hypothetical protein